MLQPKRTKFRKAFKGRIHGNAKGGTELNFGAFGLKAMEPERITARQIEAARRAITRHIKRSGRLWIRVFPDVPVSSKPAEVRMGSGKGSPEFWVARVKPGRILFELDGVPGYLAKTAFERAAEKLPIKTKVVARLGETLAGEEKEEGRRSQGQDRRPAAAAAWRPEARAVQPALPVGDQPAREAEPCARGAPHHRAHQDAADRTRPRAVIQDRGEGLRRVTRCQSASSPALSCRTRVTRRSWSVSSGG